MCQVEGHVQHKLQHTTINTMPTLGRAQQQVKIHLCVAQIGMYMLCVKLHSLLTAMQLKW